jgi:shikimate dehydrogenase
VGQGPPARARRVFLLGHGISYSRSPAMQNSAFRAAGLDWTYELMDVPAEQLGSAVHSLRAHDVAGANVTIPHKLAVMEHLDRIDADALRAHAVNTIKHEGEHLVGYNTDVAGIRAAIDDVELNPRGATATVLGAGGSARAAAVALEGAHITFVSRHPESVGEMPGKVMAWNDPAWPTLVRTSDVLLNATPLGRREEMPLRPNALPTHGVVIDLVYVNGGTPLVRKARSLGLATADGWRVLLAQGAQSFEIWTGVQAPLEAMKAGMEAE